LLASFVDGAENCLRPALVELALRQSASTRSQTTKVVHSVRNEAWWWELFSDYRIVVVPYASNAYFVGRSSIMEKLKEMLSPSHCRKKTTHHVRVALHGLGGVG